jgi:formate hydrogenlyase subunit 3/multisubunit Na+/H+ antiporter MnhD subunit
MTAPVAGLVALVLLFGLWPTPLLHVAGTGAAGLLDPAAYLTAVAGAAP